MKAKLNPSIVLENTVGETKALFDLIGEKLQAELEATDRSNLAFGILHLRWGVIERLETAIDVREKELMGEIETLKAQLAKKGVAA